MVTAHRQNESSLKSGLERRSISRRLEWCHRRSSCVIMSNLSDEKRGIIIGARPVGAFMSRTANLVGVSRTNVSRVMTACTNLDHLRAMPQTLFPGERPVFQDDNFTAHTSCGTQIWLYKHDDEVQHTSNVVSRVT
ncbi:hypothetical protein TNCV_3084501 [Trichonephila clavipes]|nr:hypothetical protein TNCV_3084501 [Trichonephila clavipes]